VRIRRNSGLSAYRVTPLGCWEWMGCRVHNGYGQVRIGGKNMLAHRAMYEKEHGPIPDGLWVLHKCDNRPCINPDHLFLGTRQDNVNDMLQKGRMPRLDGERAPRRRLTAEQVSDIISRCRSGETQASVAEKHAVHPAHVSRIVNRRRWPNG
jgi:hypothetical protein